MSAGLENGARFSIEATVRWSDLDAFAHANNQAYLRWCEDARNAQVVALGLGRPAPERPSLIILTNHSEFLAPLFLDDRIVITRRIVRVGRTSHDASYEIFRGEEPVFRGRSSTVLFDARANAAVPYPEDARRRMTGA